MFFLSMCLCVGSNGVVGFDDINDGCHDFLDLLIFVSINYLY